MADGPTTSVIWLGIGMDVGGNDKRASGEDYIRHDVCSFRTIRASSQTHRDDVIREGATS